LRLDVTGAVQGVGFRPLVYRLAISEGLAGFVRNTVQGASLEVEGSGPAMVRFFNRLDDELRPPADIRTRRSAWLNPAGDNSFVIASSELAGNRPAVVLPDLATCPECLAETLDREDRRYRYPFTTCTICGPRYSIIESVPYDRARTSMRHFPMCASCEAEYHDPASRRFHAETNSCPTCGPQLTLLGADGETVATGDHALIAAADAVASGRIIALKGLGGFQLVVDARDPAAVDRLRERKRRPAKPFAIMSATLAEVAALVHMSPEEERLLASAAAPIVLLRVRAGMDRIAPAVAPANPWLGIMLPATPLHHLLLRELGFPVVATSGNRRSEPIVTDETEAPTRLGGIADLFLVHDRPILRPVDDSVARLIAGRETVLRHARGYAPQVFPAPDAAPCLALGAHQKVAVAIGIGGDIILGQHIGDLDAAETRASFATIMQDMTELHGQLRHGAACDTHPGYHTTRIAERLVREPIRVPHHVAHVLAGTLDNGLEGAVLGVAWDGTGDGADGTIWGGELLAVDDTQWRRVAHLLPFRLPGGETSVREPCRAAVGALHAVFGDDVLGMTDLAPVATFGPTDRPILGRMLARAINAPLTSSAGRLFDAVAAILGLCQKMSFEGEAAMAVEFAAERAGGGCALPSIDIAEGSPMVLDWRPMLAGIVAAHRDGTPADALAASFHDALADAIVAVARRVDTERVLLTGGCFQNRQLAERAIAELRRAGLQPYWHHRIPPNDGGIAAGQAAFAARPRRMGES
jgi:hydrogenase maturation protein HypF